MDLEPPPNDWEDTSLDALFLSVQQHAAAHGYAVVKGRTARFKDGVVRKAWLRCDRGGRPKKNNKSVGKHLTSSQLIDCLFQAIAQRTRVGSIQSDWALTIVNPDHNHDSTIAGSHPSLCKLTMTDKVQNTIINQTRAGARPSAIISSLRLDHDKENPMLKQRDVYNIKA